MYVPNSGSQEKRDLMNSYLKNANFICEDCRESKDVRECIKEESEHYEGIYGDLLFKLVSHSLQWEQVEQSKDDAEDKLKAKVKDLLNDCPGLKFKNFRDDPLGLFWFDQQVRTCLPESLCEKSHVYLIDQFDCKKESSEGSEH